MKISKQQLKQIIKEELENVLRKEEHVEEPYAEEVLGTRSRMTDLGNQLHFELQPLDFKNTREELITLIGELGIDLGGVSPENAIDWALEQQVVSVIPGQ